MKFYTFLQPFLKKLRYAGVFCKTKHDMAKILRVVEPFFIMEMGDTFEYSEDAEMYVSKHKEDFYRTDCDSVNEIKSSYNSEFRISVDYAKSLISEGYLEEATEMDGEKKFVNIFDEIDNLLNKYTDNLKHVEENTAGLPACVRVEQETVLTNMITLLEHLKGLKK